MALDKQPLTINFLQGINTKSDPFQVPAGQFLELKNTVFTQAGLLAKRNGYGYLATISDSDANYLTTFNNNLVAVGSRLSAYSQSVNAWVDKGEIHPARLDVLPLVRSTLNQSQADSAVSSNGLVCTTFTDDIPNGSGGSTPSYKYVIADAATSQAIINPTVIPVGTGAQSGPARAFVLGKYFVLVYSVTITATPHLQAFIINSANISQTIANVDISSQYTPATTLAFDGVVANNALYIAWNGSDLGGAIRVNYLDVTLNLHSTQVIAGYTGTLFSFSADTTTPIPNLYLSFYNSGSQLGYTTVLDANLNTVTAPVAIISALSVLNLTSTANSGRATLFYEVANNYGYDSTIATHFIRSRTVTQGGSVGSSSIIVRSVGLASKAFLVDENPYFLSIYSSANQPSYFLLTGAGEVVSKLAYGNGGSYYTHGLPNVTLTDNKAQIAYQIKDLLIPVNKEINSDNTTGFYTQTGVNLASFTIGNVPITTAEIGQSLYLSGGILWQYDGVKPVEQGFNLWPDYVETTIHTTGGAMKALQYYYQAVYEWSDNQGIIHRSAPSLPVSANLSASSPSAITFTSVFSSGASTITVSSVTNLQVGQVITDNTTGGNIQAGTKITAINGSVLTLSLPTAGNSAAGPGDTLQTVTRCSVTINVPTLRLTYKIASPVKITLYRWSTEQQVFYEISSISSPLLNDTTVDYVTYVDTLADSSIIGNFLLYTTGGVLENIGAPATNLITLFNNRLWAIQAEDPNNAWFSKQVIQGTPVEMSDLLTYYAAPTAATAGAPGTGPITSATALDDKLIFFKNDAIYYTNGSGPDSTGANSQYSDPVFVTAVVGCSNQGSIVFIPNGLMFESHMGIWLLGRDLSTSYIGVNVEGLTDAGTVLSAVNVPDTTQVRFSLDTGLTLMYDYYYQQWGSFTNVKAVSSTIHNLLHTYVDDTGQVYQETIDAYLDGANPVLMSFTTSWFKLTGLQGFQRAYFLYLIGVYYSPHRLQVQVAYDYNPSPTQSTIITPDNYGGTWGSESTWGGGDSWGGPGNLEQWRVFFEQQKCEAFQLIINETVDPAFQGASGKGLTLSGLNLQIGMKDTKPRLRASRQAG